jgi:glucokinase
VTILACDLGGTRIKLGLVRDGALISIEVLPAHSDRPLRSRLDAVARSFRRLCDEAQIAIASCAGLGVSFPSLVDAASAQVLDEHGKYRDAPGFDLRGWAQDALGLPLAMENDARMALIGEWRYGAGRGCDNLVMITLGTGLGTSAVIEGRVLRGKHGQAGCLGGHLTVRYEGRHCGCGNIGCAEAEASTSVLAKLAHESEDFASSALAREPKVDYAAVFRLADADDPCARRLRDHSLRVWSALAVSLVHAYDPEMLILGGGIMASGEAILPFVRDYVHRHARTPWGKVRVVASQLGDPAALLACEWLVNEQSRGARQG